MQRQHCGSHRVEHAANHKDDVFVFGGRRLHSLQVAQIQQVHQGEFQKVEHEQDAASVGGALLEDAIGKSVVENAKQKCRQRVFLGMKLHTRRDHRETQDLLVSSVDRADELQFEVDGGFWERGERDEVPSSMAQLF